MATTPGPDRLTELLGGPLGRDEYDQVVEAVYESYATVDAALDLARDMEAELEELSDDEQRDRTEKLGVLEYALGRYEAAARELEAVRTRKTAAHFLGLACLQLGRDQEALEYLDRGRADQDDLQTDVRMVDAHCRLKEVDEAEKLIQKHRKERQGEPDFQYAMGRIAEARGDYEEAMERYGTALKTDPEHPYSLFRLALNCDLNGEDGRAIEYYERAVNQRPTFVGALLNLGVLYEDHGRDEEAIECYKRVLAIDPSHQRARLYLRDAESSLTMYVDMGRLQRLQHREQVFRLPVANFELSARSRNALDRMDVRTLGGLASLTRDQLLGEKNFGDTSLTEIEDLLQRYNLELKDEGGAAGRFGGTSPALEQKLARPVEEMEFSTRCRKCMDRLGIATVGELTQKTEQDLLNMPNFGATSLQEVKTKLAALGLSLKGE